MIVQDYGFGLRITDIQSPVKIKTTQHIFYRRAKPCARGSISEEVKCLK